MDLLGMPLKRANRIEMQCEHAKRTSATIQAAHSNFETITLRA
jgi:hypothetical protein